MNKEIKVSDNTYVEQPDILVVLAPESEPKVMLRITPDGRFELGEGVTVTEAAAQFATLVNEQLQVVCRRCGGPLRD